MPNLSWGAPAGTIRRRRLLGFGIAAVALLAVLVFAADAKAQPTTTVEPAAAPRTGGSHGGEGTEQESKGGSTEEASKQDAGSGSEEGSRESGAPPAREGSKEPPPTEEAGKEGEVPPGEEAPNENEPPPKEEAPEEPPTEEGPHEAPAEEEAHEEPAPPVEEAPQQEQDEAPGSEEDNGAAPGGGEQEALGTGLTDETEREDRTTSDAEADGDTAHHSSGSEEAAQRASVSEEAAEASAEGAREGARLSAPLEGAEAPVDQQDSSLEAQADELNMTSGLVGSAEPASTGALGVHAAAIGQFAEETAARLTGELSCELATLGEGGDGCSAGWPGDRAVLASLPEADVVTAISTMMAAQSGSPARAGHGASSLGSVPVAPAPGSVPGGSSGAAAGGASGAAPSPGLTQSGMLLSGAPRAMHTLRLSSQPWLTTYYALIPERPG